METLQERGTDLRSAAIIIWRSRIAILVATGLVAGLAYTAGKLMPSKYESSAQLVLSEPVVEEGRAVLGPQLSPHKGMLELVRTRELLQEVYQAGQEQGWIDSDASLSGFLGRCSAEMPENWARLIRLTVRSEGPDAAAALTNLWAEQAHHHINNLFGMSDQRLQQLEAQLQDTRQRWDQAKQALYELIPEARLDTRRSQLKQLREQMERRMNQVDRIDQTVARARTLQRRLTATTAADNGDQTHGDSTDIASLTLGDQLSLVSILAEHAGPLGNFQLQVGPDGLGQAPRSADDAQHLLDQLAEALSELQTQLRQEVERLVEEIGQETVELERAEYRLARAQDEHSRAREAYNRLAERREELQLVLIGRQEPARIASRALPRPEPVMPKATLFALAGLVLTPIVGAALAVLRHELRKLARDAEASESSEAAKA